MVFLTFLSNLYDDFPTLAARSGLQLAVKTSKLIYESSVMCLMFRPGNCFKHLWRWNQFRVFVFIIEVFSTIDYGWESAQSRTMLGWLDQIYKILTTTICTFGILANEKIGFPQIWERSNQAMFTFFIFAFGEAPAPLPPAPLPPAPLPPAPAA